VHRWQVCFGRCFQHESFFDLGTLLCCSLTSAPLAGFHNASHNVTEQRARYDAQYQRQGLLGPEPLPGGWITEIDKIIAREESVNEDLKIYYGGRLLYPRIFAFVNQDISYSIVSVVLVGIFMWVQLGSLWLTSMGIMAIVMSLALTLSTWKLIGNSTITFMQVFTVCYTIT